MSSRLRAPSPQVRSLTSRRHRRGESAMSFVGGAFIVVIVAVCYIAYAWFPAYWDYMAMKEISLTVVRDWSNHENREKAVLRLNTELRKKDVSEDITTDACNFIDRKGKLQLECTWTTYAYYPGTSYYKAFDGWVTATADGSEGSFGPG